MARTSVLSFVKRNATEVVNRLIPEHTSHFYTLFFCTNLFYKNVEAEIGEILRLY